MFTHTGTTELPYGVTRHDPLCDECSKPKAEHCATCEECPLTDGACWCTAETFSDGEPTPNAIPAPAAPAPKLTLTQVNLLRYFAGDYQRTNATRGDLWPTNHARLIELGFIKPMDAFPFHTVTAAGRDHLAELWNA